MSKAHIWPEWLLPHNPASGDDHLYVSGDFSTFEPNERVKLGPRFTKKFQGPTGSKKVRRVCARCNSGWMSRIEDRSKNLILELMKADRLTLRHDQQHMLATWIALLTMTHELVVEAPAIPESDRAYLMQNLEPPPHWRIYIFKYLGNQWHDHTINWQGLWISRDKDEVVTESKCNTQVSTFVVGQLGVHVFSSQVWTDFGGYEGDIPLRQIWPIRQKRHVWGVVSPLTDIQIVFLSEAIPRHLMNKWGDTDG